MVFALKCKNMKNSWYILALAVSKHADVDVQQDGEGAVQMNSLCPTAVAGFQKGGKKK